MRTFESYLQEAQGFQGPFKPGPDTKRQAIELNNKVTQKRKPGGALATRPADKGASIVRQKRGGTGKEAVGVPKKSGPGVGGFDKAGAMTKSKGGAMSIYDKERERIRARKDAEKVSSGSKVSSALKGTAKAGLGLAKKAVDSTKGTSVETSSSGSLGGPTLSQGGRTSK